MDKPYLVIAEGYGPDGYTVKLHRFGQRETAGKHIQNIRKRRPKARAILCKVLEEHGVR